MVTPAPQPTLNPQLTPPPVLNTAPVLKVRNDLNGALSPGGLPGEKNQQQVGTPEFWATFLDTLTNKMQANNREAQKEATEDARRFALYLSNTAYQRGIEDMRKAGINPIYAFMRGGNVAASTPSVATAEVDTTNYQTAGIQSILAAVSTLTGSISDLLGAFSKGAGGMRDMATIAKFYS